MSLRNLTNRNVTVKAKSIVAQVTATNAVPPMLTPKNSQESEKQKDKRTKSPHMNPEAPIKMQLTKGQLKNYLIKLTWVH